jgi:hypothetical protein
LLLRIEALVRQGESDNIFSPLSYFFARLHTLKRSYLN